MFGSIKTTMMEFFDVQYTPSAKASAVAASTAVVAAGVGTGRVFQYRDFDNTNPPTFNRVQYLIVAIRWISDVEGCFFMCLCTVDQKVRFALNF